MCKTSRRQSAFDRVWSKYGVTRALFAQLVCTSLPKTVRSER
jgi:hypothetical protein